MAIDTQATYTIRNSAGREVEVPGDVLRLRSLGNTDDVVLFEGDEIPIVEFIVSQANSISGDAKDSVRRAQRRNRESAQASQEVAELAKVRILRSRANEEEMAAEWALVRETSNQPGAAQRADEWLSKVDDYNRARSAGAPQPYEGEPEPDVVAALDARGDAAARATTEELDRLHIERVQRESSEDSVQSDGSADVTDGAQVE